MNLIDLFSNGDLDPWSSGGVTKSVSDSLVAIIIKNGGHHLDLRGSYKDDLQSVKDAREQEKKIIRSWISPHHHVATMHVSSDGGRLIKATLPVLGLLASLHFVLN